VRVGVEACEEWEEVGLHAHVVRGEQLEERDLLLGFRV